MQDFIAVHVMLTAPHGDLLRKILSALVTYLPEKRYT